MTIIHVQEDPETKELFLVFPDDLIEALGWQIGDNIKWNDAGEGKWLLKKETEKKDVADGS